MVDGAILCFARRPGLPAYHANVRFRFSLAVGLGVTWTRDGGINMVASEHDTHCGVMCLWVLMFGTES